MFVFIRPNFKIWCKPLRRLSSFITLVRDKKKYFMVNCLEEYVSEVYKILDSWDNISQTIHPWFRGQSNSNWDLIPRLFRSMSYELEREILRDFKLNARSYLSRLPQNEFDWLFVMQHYGLPTRLLDWSESHLIALYFATVDFSNDYDAIVWILHPWTLNENQKILNQRTVPVTSNPELFRYLLGNTYKMGDENGFSPDPSRTVKAKYPVAIRANRDTPRIIAQKGVFTLHGYDKKGLNKIIPLIEKFSLSHIKIDKIIINGKSKLKILKQLYLAGINNSVVFPEIEGIAKEIAFRYSDDYFK